MASLNHVTLIGRLTADPETRYIQSGDPVVNFTVAVDRKFSKNDETDFIPVVAWRKLAEICQQYLHKGKLVAVTGRLQTRSYEDKDGNKRKAFEVQADEMVMLGGKSEGGGQRESIERKIGNEVDSRGFEPAGDQLGIDQIPF